MKSPDHGYPPSIQGAFAQAYLAHRLLYSCLFDYLLAQLPLCVWQAVTMSG